MHDVDDAAVAAAEPSPDLSFDALPLSDDVRQALAEMGYTHAAPVQHAVYDPAVRGMDLVVQARTGTGKTAAFGIPLIDRIIQRSLAVVQCLILVPTRELALQVSRELDRIGSRRGMQTAAVYGGAPIQRQIDAIRGGARIVAGTPGRVLDHLRRGTLDPKTIRVLVLDESDEMLSMGFERELHAILEFLPKERQTLLFSATLPPQVVRMSENRLRNPQFISLSGDHIGALDVVHYVYMIQEEKAEAFMRIIETENPASAIIFCNTKDETERVAASLQRSGYDADWLNGDLPQSDREKVMARTREGKLRFLVATDVAARGIDISHLSHVINFDFPESPEQYVHRTGRTGRMGSTGTALSLITPQDIGSLYYLRLTYKIRPFEKQIPTSSELKTRGETDLIQMMALAFAAKQPHPDDLALARRLLTHDSCENIVAGLLRDHLGERASAQEEASAARRARIPEPTLPRADRSSRVERTSSPSRSRLRTSPRPRDDNEEPRQPPVRQEPAPAPKPPPVAEPRPAAAERDSADARPPRRDARIRERSRSRERVEQDALPRYEVTPLTEEVLQEVQASIPRTPPKAVEAAARPMAHTALADWEPPPEDNDDLPILDDAPDTEPPVGDDSDDIGDQLEMFLNVGRRDGVRAGDFLRVIEEAEGLSRRDVGRIRIRDRHTFINVRKDVFDRALEAFNGSRIGNRIVSAELARARDSFSPAD